jgi:hypothetical protein
MDKNPTARVSCAAIADAATDGGHFNEAGWLLSVRLRS